MPSVAEAGQFILALAFVLILAVVGVWDAYAAFSGQQWASVSVTIRDWISRWPIGLLLLGLILGHLFWR